MKTKRGKSGTGLKDYVKKSNRIEKILKAHDSKTGKDVFVSRKEIMTSGDRYKPGERFSKADIELAKNAVSKRTGGAMLKNPGKADLDKDGKLSGYEKKRGKAIEKAMGAKRGTFLQKTKRQKFGSEFSTYNKMRDMFDKQKKMQQRKKEMEKDKQKISEKKKGIAVKSGGMMKYNKGGGADTGKKGELKSRIGVATNKLKRVNRMLKKISGRKTPKRPKGPERKPMIPLQAKEGKAVVNPVDTIKKRIKNDPRTRDQRVKDAFPKKGPRGRAVISTLGSQNPMKRDRLREGAKARRRKMFVDAIKKLGAAGKRLTPGGAGSEIARKIGEKISKKMGGGMMMKPMGYKSGTSVMARGCKLGRKKATKIM